MNLFGATNMVNLMGQSKRLLLQITKTDMFFKMNSTIEIIEMVDGMCNDSNIKRWNLYAYPMLRQLTVGNNCLHYVKDLALKGCNSLEMVSIGSNCFMKSKGGCMEMSNCPLLKNVSIGDCTCVDWSVFVMKSCGTVEVSIGDGCFPRCERVVFEGV